MSFSLHEATQADIPGVMDAFYRSFTMPSISVLFPSTPPGRAWMTACYSKSLATSTPSQSCFLLVIRDDSDLEKKIVAFARYLKLGDDWSADWRERWVEPVAEGMDERVLSEGFFDPMQRQHRVAVGEKKHYFLEVLGTHEDYRGLGLASKLLKRGCEMADEEGMDTYLDAAKLAKPLYERFGFVEGKWDEKAVSAPMLRPAKKIGN